MVGGGLLQWMSTPIFSFFSEIPLNGSGVLQRGFETSLREFSIEYSRIHSRSQLHISGFDDMSLKMKKCNELIFFSLK